MPGLNSVNRETAAGAAAVPTVEPDLAEKLSKLALSQTHRHLLAVINTELARRSPDDGRTIRLLDAGCGDGLLLLYLLRALPQCWPALRFEFWGFDVGDHGVQLPGFLLEARARLEREAGSRGWDERILLISERDPWPFEDGAFDVVVSNQVLEHVRDQRLFFDQIARVLNPRGFSAHVFPSAHCVVEPHLKVPFAQRIGDAKLLAAWIALWSRLGFSNYGAWARSRSGLPETSSIADYARMHVDFLAKLTNFRTQRQLLSTAKESRLLASFCYTAPYVSGKLRSLAGRGMRLAYRSDRPYRSHLAGLLVRYVTSVTLLVYK